MQIIQIENSNEDGEDEDKKHEDSPAEKKEKQDNRTEKDLNGTIINGDYITEGDATDCLSNSSGNCTQKMLQKEPELKKFKERQILEHDNQFSDDFQDYEENFHYNIKDDSVLQQPEIEKTVEEERPTVREEENLCYVSGEEELCTHDSSSEESTHDSSSEESICSIYRDISFDKNIDEDIKKYMENYDGQCRKHQEGNISLESVRSNNSVSLMNNKTNMLFRKKVATKISLPKTNLKCPFQKMTVFHLSKKVR